MGGVPRTFFAFFSPTKAAPSNFRSRCSDPRAFLSGLFPRGSRIPLVATLLEGEIDIFECDYFKGSEFSPSFDSGYTLEWVADRNSAYRQGVLSVTDEKFLIVRAKGK